MGGHGGLNILHHKSWNVYGKRQRKKVKEDEEKHAREEEAKRKEREKEEAEQRLQTMRKRAREGDRAPLFFTHAAEQVDSEEESINDSLSPRQSAVVARTSSSSAIHTGIKFMVSEEMNPKNMDGERRLIDQGSAEDSSRERLQHVDLFVDDVTKLQKTGRNEKHEELKKEEDLKALRRIHPTIFFAEAGHKAANPWYTRKSSTKESRPDTKVTVVGVDAASRKLIEKSSFGRSKQIMQERLETLKEHSKRWNDPLASIQSTLGKNKMRYLVKREGVREDWNCPKCHYNNFGRNKRCHRCKTPKPSEEDGESNNPVLKRKFRSGDWVCPAPSCAHHNYKDNKRCFKCGTTPDQNIDVFNIKLEQEKKNQICDREQSTRKRRREATKDEEDSGCYMDALSKSSKRKRKEKMKKKKKKKKEQKEKQPETKQ